MNIIQTQIKDLLVIEPQVFYDERGYFLETYNQKAFQESGIDTIFVQDNQSFSKKGVLRGLHFQNPPFAQAKLIRVIVGKVIDVAVDLRKNSSTYGQYVSVELSAENNRFFFIPEGFAHGFIALEDTIFSYKCSNLYHKASEGCILWNDPDLNINWNLQQPPIISSKDLEGL